MKVSTTIAEIAYQAILCLLWPALYLYYLCRSRTDGKYLSNYRGRLGLDLPDASQTSEKVWFHALSVGETLSAVPLVKEIKKRCPDLRIFFSTATETGMSMAKDRLSADVDHFFYMPHDFPWAVNALVRRLYPMLFVLIETDLWPNLLRALKREGVFTALVNGRISPGSYRKYLRFAGLMSTLFSRFDIIFSQTVQDKTRFESLGAPAGKVATAGNLKFDSSATAVSASEREEIRNRIGLDAERLVWVAGSTHEGEEEIVLRVHRELLTQTPDLLLIIAPRKIDRRDEITVLCRALGFDCALRSKGEGASGKDVYLLDTLGELSGIYSVCDVAFLGGSLVPFGGHNPLEAVAHGKPACWGLYFFNFHEIEAALIGSGICRKISSESELKDFVRSCLSMKVGSKSYVFASIPEFQLGAAGRIASALLEKI